MSGIKPPKTGWPIHQDRFPPWVFVIGGMCMGAAVFAAGMAVAGLLR